MKPERPSPPRRKENPGLYRRMQEPIPVAEAEKRVETFWEEVYKLREACHLMDVHIIFKVKVIFEDGHEGDVISDMHVGSELECEPMTAWAYGQQAARRQARLAEIVASAQSIKKRKNRE
jgi:hypothetical protein